MMQFDMKITNSGGYFSQLISTLINLDIDPNKLYLQALSSGFLRLNEDLEILLSDVDRYQIQFGLENDISSVGKKFENCAYRAAELFEAFEHLPNYLVQNGKRTLTKVHSKEYRGLVNKYKRSCNLICNKIKHNSNLIIPVLANNEIDKFPVLGFILVEPSSSTEVPKSTSDSVFRRNRELHSNDEAFISFNRFMREMIASIVYLDFRAARYLSDLYSEKSLELLVRSELENLSALSLRLISHLPIDCGSDEPRMVDSFRIEDGRLKFIRQQLSNLSGIVSHKFFFTVAPFVTSYQIIPLRRKAI